MIAPDLLARLRAGEHAVWRRPGPCATTPGIGDAELDDVRARLRRFQPLLAEVFANGWDGRIASALDAYHPAGLPPLLVKRDDALPMTGSIKARGGVYELLCAVEDFARHAGVLGNDYRSLLSPAAKAALAAERVVVASTGNLGFSVGLVGSALGVHVEVHMSHDAKAWKKDRLRAVGATVIEHAGDYHAAVVHARVAAAANGAYFVDDENSPRLFAGYAAAADEVAEQLAERGVTPTAARPLVAYLPCGVGGAPGGVLAGLKRRWGEAVIGVFVEPVASPCLLVALATGGDAPVSVYDVGLDNRTIADGLAVPLASPLVLARIGGAVAAAVAVPDAALKHWVKRVWQDCGWRLEPSAAAGFAALDPLLAAWPELAEAHHLIWTTGGAMLPDAEFHAYFA
ncbi:MAG: D-serine ammonia-lyase [Sphingomonadaceae bacterium]|nr:D-serine ammonia-lyase [Sphingomonadaceae bacterium]